ncbi:NUDIX hydrolase [Halobacteriales archaeon QS_1_67_19]|nr:MAG: NUDIX hydrolase [Halobacteriales archaeon QS_1_67_19]
MVKRPPEHCPACGTPLAPVDPPGVFDCESCDGYVFHDPTPNARAIVLDGERVLLVEIADRARLEDPPYEADSEWMTPGGHLELGEQPAVAAARELEEETGLVVDPDALELVDAVARQVIEGVHGVVLLYAVEREAAAGTPSAGSDAAGARFWSPAELAESEATFRDLHREPAEYRALDGLVRRARAALDAPDG